MLPSVLGDHWDHSVVRSRERPVHHEPGVLSVLAQALDHTGLDLGQAGEVVVVRPDQGESPLAPDC